MCSNLTKNCYSGSQRIHPTPVQMMIPTRTPLPRLMPNLQTQLLPCILQKVRFRIQILWKNIHKTRNQLVRVRGAQKELKNRSLFWKRWKVENTLMNIVSYL